MVSEAMKYKALKALSEGALSRSDLFNRFRSRGVDFVVELEEWLSDKMSAKYKLPVTGRTATIYSIEPAGVRELERLSKMIEDA